MIRRVNTSDTESILQIYNHYIDSSIATFETEPVSVSEMQDRIRSTLEHYPWLVHAGEDGVDAYAYATRWKPRNAYRKTVESAIYVSPAVQGEGVGTRLYSSLIEEVRVAGFHAMLAGIALPNTHSIALHEKLGFVNVGQLREVGNKFQRWIDVGYWQLLLQSR